MRKITIADFSLEQSEKYAKLQRVTESVWSANYEAQIVRSHVLVRVTTSLFYEDQTDAGTLDPFTGLPFSFYENTDLDHYKNPMRRRPIAAFDPPKSWRYFPASWMTQHKFISNDLCEWEKIGGDINSCQVGSGGVENMQMKSVRSFASQSIALVKCSLEAMANRARFQGA